MFDNKTQAITTVGNLMYIVRIQITGQHSLPYAILHLCQLFHVNSETVPWPASRNCAEGFALIGAIH